MLRNIMSASSVHVSESCGSTNPRSQDADHIASYGATAAATESIPDRQGVMHIQQSYPHHVVEAVEAMEAVLHPEAVEAMAKSKTAEKMNC